MKWLKEGLSNLKKIDWIRMEYILVIALGIFWRAGGDAISLENVRYWAGTLLTGELWLPPLALYILIRTNSVNQEIFQNKNARRVLLLIFLMIELISIMLIVSDPRFPIVANWLQAIGRGETTWWS